MNYSIGKIYHDKEGRYILNRWKARIYIDQPKIHEELVIAEIPLRFKLLAVEYINEAKLIPVVTLETPDKPEAYRIPVGLYGWAYSIIKAANKGTVAFPCHVEFEKLPEGRLSAKLFP